MAAPIQSPSKCEVLSVIRFLNAKGEHPAEIHKQIVAVYVKLWIGKMWRSGAVNSPKDVHEEQRSGRPSLISDDLLQETEGEIRANRRMTIRELHRIIPEVSKTTINEAATEKLRYRKLWARWVPKILTDDHKTKRMGSALKLFTHRKERSFWTPSWLEMKHGYITTLLNPSNNYWGARRSHDVVQRAGSRLLWLGDTEAGSKT